MILATDVYYIGNSARAAGILFPNWRSKQIADRIIKYIAAVEPYQPGQFYKRELPCILELLAEVDDCLDAIVVDGFVTLGVDAQPGMGMYLYKQLNESTPVIGVAKNAFGGTPAESAITRGDSRRPLFISAAGIQLSQAKKLVREMHGENRIPTILKQVDHLCRGINS